MHFCIYFLLGGVIFMLWPIEQVVLVGYLVSKMSNTTNYVAVEKEQSSLAILDLSFELLEIWTVQVQ